MTNEKTPIGEFLHYAMTGRLPAGDPAGERIHSDYSGDSPAQRLRAGRLLANVQRHQSEFWQAVRELEECIGEMRGDDCELDSAKDFNDLSLEDVLEGHGEDEE